MLYSYRLIRCKIAQKDVNSTVQFTNPLIVFLFIQAEIVATIVILLLPPTKRVKEVPQRTQLKGGITPGGN